MLQEQNLFFLFVTFILIERILEKANINFYFRERWKTEIEKAVTLTDFFKGFSNCPYNRQQWEQNSFFMWKVVCLSPAKGQEEDAESSKTTRQEMHLIAHSCVSYLPINDQVPFIS